MSERVAPASFECSGAPCGALSSRVTKRSRSATTAASYPGPIATISSQSAPTRTWSCCGCVESSPSMCSRERSACPSRRCALMSTMRARHAGSAWERTALAWPGNSSSAPASSRSI
eukprot:scaffold12382_cov118-Isochrysis_galbana.AAC.5